MKISTTPKEVAERIAKQLYGETLEDVIPKGICIQCKQDALKNCYSDAGRREYRISGLCEKCFDEICGG